MMFFWLLTGIPFLYLLFRIIRPHRDFKWRKLAAAIVLFMVAFKFQILRGVEKALRHILPSADRAAETMFFAPDLPGWLMLLGSWVFAAFLFFFVLVLLTDIFLLGQWIMRKVLHLYAGKFMPRHRKGYLLVLLTIAFLLSSWGMIGAKRAPEVREEKLDCAELPQELNGLCIVLLADLHVDKLTTTGEIEEIVRRTNQLRPDLILIAGDFADGTVAKVGGKLEPLRKLHAGYGVFGVPGNHEYYSGYGEWMQFLRSLGIRMLENEHVMLVSDKLALGGITDPAAKIRKLELPDVEKAFAGTPEGAFKLLLAHQPKYACGAAELGVNLQLSGHTHGGMILGLDCIIALLNQGFVSGRYTVGSQGDVLLYVSRGTSLWKGFPIRIGVPSEITRFVLIRK